MIIFCWPLVVLVLLFIGIYNRLVDGAQRVQERLRADRRAAHPPLRPDPEPGRDREGLHEARARDARERDPRPQHRGGRPEGGRRESGGRRRGAEAVRRGGAAERRARAAVRARRGLSGPQGQPEHDAALRGAHLHGEQGGVRAPGVQRLGDELQQPARDVPEQHRRRHVQLRSRRSCSTSRSPKRARRRRSASADVDFYSAPGRSARRQTRWLVVGVL